MTFKNLVVNTLLSGLEAETLRTCDYEKLEKCLIGLGRKVVGREGIYIQADTRRQHSSSKIRELLSISSCFIELRIRRLQWITEILKHPSHNIQLRAALGGRMKLEHAEIDEEFTPWLAQTREDLAWYIAQSAGLGREADRTRGLEGHILLETWAAENKLIQILDARHMKWYRTMTIEFQDLRCFLIQCIQGADADSMKVRSSVMKL